MFPDCPYCVWGIPKLERGEQTRIRTRSAQELANGLVQLAVEQLLIKVDTITTGKLQTHRCI